MLPRRAIVNLVTAALGLPVVIVILALTGRWLELLGDAGGAVWLQRGAALGVALWAMTLVLLVIGVAMDQIFPPGPRQDD